PLFEAPCDSPPNGLGLGGDVEFRLIALRVSGLPEDAERGWSIREAAGSASAAAKKDGKTLPGVNTLLVGLPANLEICSVEFRAATVAWRTVGATQSPGAFSSKPGPSYIVGEAVASKNGTTLSVAHDIGDVAVRLVAVDRTGRERPSVRNNAMGVRGFYQI